MASHPSTHELIVRGACVSASRVLLCRQRGLSRSFLPGGHVESGEGAEEALRREFREELGVSLQSVRFLGVVEHGFATGDGPVCEVNLVFAVEAPGVDATGDPLGREGHLEFFWQPLDRLADAGFEPAGFRMSLAEWARAPDRAALRLASSGLLAR